MCKIKKKSLRQNHKLTAFYSTNEKLWPQFNFFFSLHFFHCEVPGGLFATILRLLNFGNSIFMWNENSLSILVVKHLSPEANREFKFFLYKTKAWKGNRHRKKVNLKRPNTIERGKGKKKVLIEKFQLWAKSIRNGTNCRSWKWW